MARFKSFVNHLLSVSMIALLTLIFLAQGCDHEKPKEETNRDAKPVTELKKTDNTEEEEKKEKDESAETIDFDFADSKLSSASNEVRSLVDDLKKKKKISFERLTKLFVQQQVEAYKKNKDRPQSNFNAIWTQLTTIQSQLGNPQDIHALKIKAESLVADDIKYNKAYNLLPDVLLSKKLNCSSGTSFQQVVSRMHLKAKAFGKKNMVVIYQCGHVLYGYLSKDDKGEWSLFGVESTALGRGEIKFGLAKNLDSPLRIVDASLWILMRVLTPVLTDPEASVKLVLEKTAKKYDGQIPVARLEGKLGECPVPSNTGNSVENPPQENDPMDFGIPEVPPGDIDRKEIDEKDMSEPTNGGETRPTKLEPESKCNDTVIVLKNIVPEPEISICFQSHKSTDKFNVPWRELADITEDLEIDLLITSGIQVRAAPAKRTYLWSDNNMSRKYHLHVERYALVYDDGEGESESQKKVPLCTIDNNVQAKLILELEFDIDDENQMPNFINRSFNRCFLQWGISTKR